MLPCQSNRPEVRWNIQTNKQTNSAVQRHFDMNSRENGFCLVDGLLLI